MNEECKYCDYVSKCSRFCEYNSIMCLMHRSFPKTVDKTYEELEKENQELKKQLRISETNEETYYLELQGIAKDLGLDEESIAEDIYQKISELKKQLEDLFSENSKLRKKLEKSMTFQDYEYTLNKKIQLENQQKEFLEWLENEKDRLAKECSQIYEDSLGKTRLVSEDIFNELNDVLSKYKEIVGGKDGKN